MLLFLSIAAFPQASLKGVELFDKNDFAGAIEVLKSSQNFIDLNYLGQAYQKLGKEKDAREAFGRSFQAAYKVIAPDLLARSDFEKDSPAPVQKLSEFITANKTEILIACLSARLASAMKASSMDDSEWAIRARLFSEIGSILASGGMVYSRRELDKPPTGTFRPRPQFPVGTRTAGTEGTVRLLLLLDQKGTVKAVLPTQTLPNGYTETSFLSAAKSVYTPAERAGSPVAVLQGISYQYRRY